MTKAEIKFFDFIQKHIAIIFAAAATALGIIIRVNGLDHESGDFIYYLEPWWKQIESGGLKALANQVGNYNIPYQIIIYLLTLLPLKPLHAYKAVSCVFDLVLAISAALIAYEACNRKSKFIPALTYSLVFCSITVMLNSAFWGQCDSIYASFILLAIYFTMKDKNILCFVMLGFSLAFKLQVIFILPAFLYYYVANRKISILHFLIIPAVDFVMCLPAVFLGRDIFDIINIYTQQTEIYNQIQMNFPNLYAFMADSGNVDFYFLFKSIAFALTVFVLGTGLVFIIKSRVDLSNFKSFFTTAIWTVLTCLIFLPSMHDRYSYLLDLLLIIYAVTIRKHFWVTIVCNLVSLRNYCKYMFYYDVLDIKWTALIYLGAYAYVTYIFAKEVLQNGAKLPEKAAKAA